MKKVLLISVLVLACSGLALSDPVPAACSAGSLSSYVSLGTTGCTVGNLLFSGFVVVPSPTSIGTSVLNSGVTPVTTSNNPGLLFNVGLTSGEDVTIDYTVMVEAGSPITDSSLTVVANGTATATEAECLGGSFSTGCTGGTQVSLTDNSTTLSASNTFSGTSTIDVSTDINSGTGMISGEQENFSLSDAPEPASLTLFGIGLLGLAFVLRRKVFVER